MYIVPIIFIKFALAFLRESIHIGESVFALSDYENVAIFFNQRTTIELLSTALVILMAALCELTSYQSGVKYRSFILEKVTTPS